MHRLAEPLHTWRVRHTRPYHCKALGIVYRTIATHLIWKAGYTRGTVQTGAVTLIQQFGLAGVSLTAQVAVVFADNSFRLATRCLLVNRYIQLSIKKAR